MSSGAYDGLFKPQKWIDTISPECRDWIDGLVDTIIEKGAEPLWAEVHRQLDTLFGEAPATDTTTKDSVRRLVANR